MSNRRRSRHHQSRVKGDNNNISRPRGALSALQKERPLVLKEQVHVHVRVWLPARRKGVRRARRCSVAQKRHANDRKAIVPAQIDREHTHTRAHSIPRSTEMGNKSMIDCSSACRTRRKLRLLTLLLQHSPEEKKGLNIWEQIRGVNKSYRNFRKQAQKHRQYTTILHKKA